MFLFVLQELNTVSEISVLQPEWLSLLVSLTSTLIIWSAPSSSSLLLRRRSHSPSRPLTWKTTLCWWGKENASMTGWTFGTACHKVSVCILVIYCIHTQTTVQKFGVSTHFYKWVLLFSKGALNRSKVTVMLQNIKILNKCSSFEHSINQWTLNFFYHVVQKIIEQHNCFQYW